MSRYFLESVNGSLKSLYESFKRVLTVSQRISCGVLREAKLMFIRDVHDYDLWIKKIMI